jgi:hypothetical protein
MAKREEAKGKSRRDKVEHKQYAEFEQKAESTENDN